MRRITQGVEGGDRERRGRSIRRVCDGNTSSLAAQIHRWEDTDPSYLAVPVSPFALVDIGKIAHQLDTQQASRVAAFMMLGRTVRRQGELREGKERGANRQ